MKNTGEIRGTISFINHEKKYAIIEYKENGKKKNITGSIDPALQKKASDGKGKVHFFRTGDVVSFNTSLNPKGDRMQATEIKFLHNDLLDMLINKSKTQNDFKGYLKEAEGKLFIKEQETYLLFPLVISQWQVIPKEDLNNAVRFRLLTGTREIKAELLFSRFIPEYYSAEKAFKTKAVIEGMVSNKTPHGIYVDLFGKINAKLSPDTVEGEIKAGDKIKLQITFLSPERIVIQPADQE